MSTLHRPKSIILIALGFCMLFGMGCILTQIASRAVNTAETNVPNVVETIQATLPEQTVPTLEDTALPEVTIPEQPTAQPEQMDAICSDVDGINLCIPKSLADNLVVSTIPEVNGQDIAPWEIAPKHYQIDLQGYKISNGIWKPRINLYPIEAFRALNAENIDMEVNRLNELVSTKPTEIDSIAFIPFVNAASILNARPHYYDGVGYQVKGYGLITQFGQSFWPINNQDMLYTFQGITADGKYWISLTLPLTQRDLPADGEYIRNEDFETFANNFPTYLADVRQKLAQAEANSFNPDLGEIEKIIDYSFSSK